MQLPILCFEPILKSAVWGGEKLIRVLGKKQSIDFPIAESWELVDLPADQSVAAEGPLAGTRLSDLIAMHNTALMGDASLMAGRFPLLFKFIDATRTLSVQVHPDETAAARMGGSARPKNEAWYIVDCEPGAVIYAGLRDGVTAAVFEDALVKGTVEDCLRTIPVAPGAFYNIPAGKVHAIGAGILLAEVQQASDTTYRVFDWGRMGTDGKPRALHVEQALGCIDFEGRTEVEAPSPSGCPGVETRYFHMYRVDLARGKTKTLGATRPVVLMGVGGAGTAIIDAGGSEESLRLGDTRLVPSCISGELTLSASDDMRVLAVEIP